MRGKTGLPRASESISLLGLLQWQGTGSHRRWDRQWHCQPTRPETACWRKAFLLGGCRDSLHPLSATLWWHLTQLCTLVISALELMELKWAGRFRSYTAGDCKSNYTVLISLRNQAKSNTLLSTQLRILQNNLN